MTTSGVPRDVAIRETVDFVRRFPTRERPRVLEVGCGTGDAAVHLAELGWDVTGIDVDPVAVATAQRRGVRAIEADLLGFDSEPFDVVLFTHSLHHIAPLASALDRIELLLRADGWLLIEELDRRAFDPRADTWIEERRALLTEAGVLHADHGHRPHEHAAHAHHGHGAQHDRWSVAHGLTQRLHVGSTMQDEIAARFAVSVVERVAYLYRYLCDELEPTARGERLARIVLAQERDALARNVIGPAGLRLAARPRALAAGASTSGA